MNRVFVTGGSGFLGGALVRRLVAEGAAVTALARAEPAAQRLRTLGACAAWGDLGDIASLRAAVAGCELVYHAAARTSRGGTRDQFWADNVQGTETALRAARDAGVRRFVHVGTEAALMDGRPLVHVDESAPLRPGSRSWYAGSKAAAEQAVLAANGPDFHTIVLRPRFVWGAGDTTVLPEIASAVRAGRFTWIGGGGHQMDTTHVDNAVEGLLLAARHGRPGEAYFVTDGDRVIFRDFISELLLTQGILAPARSVPAALATAAARIGETAWRRLHLTGAPPLDYLSLWLSSQECTIDTTKARSQLGYRPVRKRLDGLAAMCC